MRAVRPVGEAGAEAGAARQAPRRRLGRRRAATVALVLAALGVAGAPTVAAPPAEAAAAATQAGASTWTVRAGDTLYAVSRATGVPWTDLARWNGLSAPYTLRIGQALRLTAPAPAPAPVTGRSNVVLEKRVIGTSGRRCRAGRSSRSARATPRPGTRWS